VTASATAAACGTLDQGNLEQLAPVTVQDASNQTDTPPVSEDENCCESALLQEKLHSHDIQVSFMDQQVGDSELFSSLGVTDSQVLRVRQLCRDVWYFCTVF
jgi:hypothetical protein